MKAAKFEATSKCLLITLYNRSNLVSLAVDPTRQKTRAYSTCKLDLAASNLVEAHFLYRLVTRRDAISSAHVHPVCCNAHGSHLSALRVPRPITGISDSRQSVDAVPDIASTDDNIAALGFSTARLITIFSFARL
ncbi:hypothetical protein LPJ56_003574 [Coemansia sp. RSA 2599]|nr:hypothetical protein LPJ56_003574 [Coemansia sp. RSA 2599]